MGGRPGIQGHPGPVGPAAGVVDSKHAGWKSTSVWTGCSSPMTCV